MKNKLFWSVFLLMVIISIIGLPIDLFSPEDASWYASIAKTMATENDFINLYCFGTDWLDKPHLPFWITALSFKIFGINEVAYKLPAVLTFFFGVWITYRFTKENYNKQTAILAVIILITSLHSVVSNFDVRAEPYLTTFIIATMYWFYRYTKHHKFIDLVIACLFAAFAIMTKGTFALIPIIAGLGGEFLVKRKWKSIANPIWLVALVLILLFITPELITLYLQFDTHPEKIVFGQKNVSGLKFFFWDSQFGRFFNTAPIKGRGDIFFFLHTILWAFLPWSVLFYIATFLKIKRNRKKINQKEEFFTVFATLATLLVFSLSKFQLAHYTNIVFPFMAILTADFIFKLQDKYVKLIKTYKIIQWILMIIGTLLIIGLSIVMKPNFNWLFVVLLLITVFIFRWIYNSSIQKHIKIFYTTATVFCLVYAFMLTIFYPTILQYQGGVKAARYVNNQDENAAIIFHRKHHFGYEFYLQKPIIRIPIDELRNHKNKLLYVDHNELKILQEKNIIYTIEKEFLHARTTKLTAKFINPTTREQSLLKRYIIRLK